MLSLVYHVISYCNVHTYLIKSETVETAICGSKLCFYFMLELFSNEHVHFLQNSYVSHLNPATLTNLANAVLDYICVMLLETNVINVFYSIKACVLITFSLKCMTCRSK